jgi:hypothetical protein
MGKRANPTVLDLVNGKKCIGSGYRQDKVVPKKGKIEVSCLMSSLLSRRLLL